MPPVLATGSGSGGTGGGGSDGGWNDGNNDDNDDDNDAVGFSANVWVLLAVALGALGIFKGYQKMQKQSSSALKIDGADYDTYVILF